MKHSRSKTSSILACAILTVVFGCAEDGGVDDGAGEASSGGEQTDTGGGDTGLTCEQIRICMDACSDDACEADCHSMGSPTGQAEFDAVAECYQSMGIMGQADAAASCGEPLAACLAHGTGNASCEEIAACADDCADQSCQQQCFDDGEARAQVEWIQLFFCLDDQCPTSEAACTASATEPGGACAAYQDACFP